MHSIAPESATSTTSPLSGEHRGTRDAGQKAAQADNFARQIAHDLLGVLSSTVPAADAAVIGLLIAAEARQREERAGAA